MDIVLRVKNRSTKKEIFINNNLKIYDKEEILLLITQQKINNLSLAKRNGKAYIKSKPNAKTTDNLSSKSISHTELISFYKNYAKAITDKNIKKYDYVRRK